jgi:hypothetical protein
MQFGLGDDLGCLRPTAHVLGVLLIEAAVWLRDRDGRDEFPARSRTEASGTAYAEFTA